IQTEVEGQPFYGIAYVPIPNLTCVYIFPKKAHHSHKIPIYYCFVTHTINKGIVFYVSCIGKPSRQVVPNEYPLGLAVAISEDGLVRLSNGVWSTPKEEKHKGYYFHSHKHCFYNLHCICNIRSVLFAMFSLLTAGIGNIGWR